MTPSTEKPRARRQRSQREKLLTVAMAIVEEEGFGALTIARIAKRMNASVGGLYRYYPNKGAMIVALQEEAIERLRDDLAARRATLDASTAASGRARRVARLRAVIDLLAAYLEHAERAPAHHRLLDSFLSEPDPILTEDEARQVDGRLEQLLSIFVELIEDAVRDGALAPGDAGARTHVAWALVHGLDHFRKRDRIQPEQLRVAVLFRCGVRDLLVGWGGEKEVVDSALRARRTS